MLIRHCKIRNCEKEYYAKGYCQKHWQYYRKPRKYGHLHKCKVRGCKEIVLINLYCSFHIQRLKRNLPLNNKRYTAKGKRNGMWKGGVAEYPNHYLMKKNRLIILIQSPKCEICGKIATEIHHRNGNKADHRLINLMASCHKCNSRIRFKPNNSKYRRLYGMSLKEVADRFGRSVTYIKKHRKEIIKTLY